MEGLLVALLIGAVSGWLASQVMKGRGMGLVGNIIVGIVGGVLGGWLLGQFGLHISTTSWVLNSIVTSVIGAVVLLWVVSLVKK